MRFLVALLLFIPLYSFSQGEANNWFFGFNAGIQFQDDGSVTPLPGSQMQTNEGCSSISDPDGNLLFYTDGRNVWDRNHIKMPNGNYDAGTGLLGDPSSTQSGIIVPKKGDPNIYYIFTVDEPHHQNAAVYPNQFTGSYDQGGSVPLEDDGFNNGFNYSIVDLSVAGANGSTGDVVTRNVHLVTYDPMNAQQIRYKCSEKITAVKNADNSGFWVITQFVDSFYAFEVTDEGVNETPVVSVVTPTIPTSGYRRNAIGYLKASPNGNMLAIAHKQVGTVQGGNDTNGNVYLYDFDNASGVVSNPLQLKNNAGPYGIEFSAQSKKLYVSYDGIGLMQYDLESANIPGSEIFIGSTGTGSALQLGPNGKIYAAVLQAAVLNVINDPEETGAACNFQSSGVILSGGMQCIFGLPPFITSIFSAEIEVTNTCFGSTTEFNLDALGDFDSVAWNFGDGATSTDENPQHEYSAVGDYTVTANITREGEVFTSTKEVTINVVPVANTALTLTECDPDNDGVTVFNLSANNNAILGNQNASEFEVKYYLSDTDAATSTNALNATSFTNTSTPQTLYARIQNRDNRKCFAVTSFEIATSNTPQLNGDSFDLCDDAADGDDTNGQVTFTLAAVTEALVQDTEHFTTTYYASQANAASETGALGTQFYNTQANQQVIFARIVNNLHSECFSIAPITLNVIPLPQIVNNALLVQCDLSVAPDGITQFNLTEADSQFTNDDPLLVTAYYVTQQAAQNDTNPVTASYTNTANPQTVWVRVTNTDTGCYRVLPLTLQVTVNVSAPITLQTCDDDGTEDGLHVFNLEDAGLEGGTDTVVYYANSDDALQEENPIALSYTNTTPYNQSIYARIENNNQCTLLQEIKLVVHALPDIETEATEIVCNNTGDYILLTSGIRGSHAGHTYLWSTGATTSSIQVNQPGVYTVTVKNSHGCEKLRTITVNPSDVARIDDIVVTDFSDNNTITVYASATGGINTVYYYSLDQPNGPFTESNFFDDVAPGIHIIYVYDTNGCGITEQEVAVLAVPKFFTPNGDGTNDFWNVIGIRSGLYEKSDVYIFDRYGKFIAGVKPNTPGWDGTYNGSRLPATDYWYVLNLQDGRVIKGHFSMVR